MARISLFSTPFINPYQRDELSLAVADFAVRAFDIARDDASLRPWLGRPDENPNLVVHVNVYRDAGGVGGGNGADRAETDLIQQDGNIGMFDDDIERLIQQVGGNIGMFVDDLTDILDDIERLIQQDGSGVLGFGAVPASASYLGSLPSTLYSETCAAADSEEQNCSICFEELVASDRVHARICSTPIASFRGYKTATFVRCAATRCQSTNKMSLSLHPHSLLVANPDSCN